MFIGSIGVLGTGWLGSVEKLTKRDLRRLARVLLEEYMKKMNKVAVVNSLCSSGDARARYNVYAGPRGFEPRTSGLGGRRPILARPRALFS